MAEKDLNRQRRDPIFGGYSGHAVTENYMGFVPLIPKNLYMVLDHNEINQNYTN